MIRKTVSFDESCPTIEFVFELVGEEKLTYPPEVLIMKVIGTYRGGSKGNPDAAFMRGMLDTAIDLWDPQTVILDLTELAYVSGDAIESVFKGPDSSTPTVVVVGPKCRKALSTLEHGENSEQDIVDHNEFFESVTEALEKLKEKRTAANNA